jgi:hypothetical protein
MERRSKEKVNYFIQEMRNKNVETSSPRHTSSKALKTQNHVTQNRTEKNNKHIPNKHRHMSLRLKICLVIGQLAVHGSQLRLELFNLPVQTANRSEHSVLLVPIVQEQVVTAQISDVSLQISNFTFQIVSLMLESHPLQQRLLVLFKVLTLAKPPVTNYSQSTPRKEKKTAENTTKLPSQNITQQIPTADIQPPRKQTVN